jgi:hypothetical protein
MNCLGRTFWAAQCGSDVQIVFAKQIHTIPHEHWFTRAESSIASKIAAKFGAQ